MMPQRIVVTVFAILFGFQQVVPEQIGSVRRCCNRSDRQASMKENQCLYATRRGYLFLAPNEALYG